ncbi:unnamed protein product [Protopolystoma xenopodis]|uniref:Laminin EGF-like domain-containing protein n=1 Tax=Protopolystoma xenopodis TaxID=117903 RepID=A0A3S5CJV1_9PLAT|nr:unnamed protein product [Protopolystoma xenopodis]
MTQFTCEIASPGFFFPPVFFDPTAPILPETIVKPDPEKPDLYPAGPSHFNWTGGVHKCNCHGMSDRCDVVTGVCANCTGNTSGRDCGVCAVGFVGDPKLGKACVKCRCPTTEAE